MAPFVSCPACGCVARSFEAQCPHCNASLRSSSLPATAAAILLGLATTTMACGDDSGSGGEGANASFYGVAGSPGTGGQVEGGAPPEGGAPQGGAPEGGGGASTDGGGGEAASFYGVPGTGGGGGAQ